MSMALEERDEAEQKAKKARKIVEKEYDWKILAPKYAQAEATVLQTG